MFLEFDDFFIGASLRIFNEIWVCVVKLVIVKEVLVLEIYAALVQISRNDCLCLCPSCNHRFTQMPFIGILKDIFDCITV